MVKTENQVCFAINCTNSRKVFPEKGFFGFPKEEILCSIWLENCGRGDLDADVVLKGKSYHKVCADHFKDECFADESKTSLNRALDPVPTIFTTNSGSSLENSAMEYNGEDRELEQRALGGMSCLKPGTELRHIDQLCRFCMNQVTDEFFETANDTGEMSELKAICELLLQKEVDFSNPLVNKICLRCVNDLKVCQTMIEQLKTADHYLRAISKFSLFFKTDCESTESDGENFVKSEINIPRRALVMPLDTFMADFDGSELYLEDIEKDSGALVLGDLIAEDMSDMTFDSLIAQAAFDCSENNSGNTEQEQPHSAKESLAFIQDSEMGMVKLSDDPDVVTTQRTVDVKKSVTFLIKNPKQEEILQSKTQQADVNPTPQDLVVSATENFDQQVNNMEDNNSCPTSQKRRKVNAGNRFSVKRRKVTGHSYSPRRQPRFILPKPTFGVEINYNITEFINNEEEDKKKNFSCKFCSMKFDSAESLMDHMGREHQDERYKCTKCNDYLEGFNTKSALINHVKENHRHECSECGAGFYSLERLNRHTAAKHDYSVDCKICGKRFRNPHRRKMHMYTHKTKAHFQVCWFCGKSIHKNSFNMHLEIHFQRPHECNICQKVCHTKSAMLYHRKSHFQPQEEEGEFLCGICPKTFRTETRLNKHIAGHAPKPLMCKHCGKKFKRIKSLQLHENNRIERGGTCPLKVIRGVPFITEEPSHPCDVCNRQFIKVENVKRHRRYHFCKGDQDVIQRLLAQPEVHKCVICERFLFSKITFQYHMSKHTGDKEPFKCEFCDKACKTHHQIAVHERRHTGERPFICRHCGRGFQEIKICRSHEATHEEDRPYPCPSCNKWFKSRRQLVSHTRTHQDTSSVRPFSCQHCKRQFILERDLQAHVSRYHSKSKEGGLELDYSNVPEQGGFACSECGRVFAMENYCKKHMRLVHGIRFVQEAVAMEEPQKLVETEVPQETQMVVEGEETVGEEQIYEVVEEGATSELMEGQVYEVVEEEYQELKEEFGGGNTEIQYVGEDGRVVANTAVLVEEIVESAS